MKKKKKNLCPIVVGYDRSFPRHWHADWLSDGGLTVSL